MNGKVDLTGKRFGRLLVLHYDYTDSLGKKRWKCRCNCGNISFPTTGNLNSKKVVSCGCWRREYAILSETTHGDTGSKMHRIWGAMIQRCHNPKTANYKNYGERGIRVCKRWRSYINFLNDMGRPEEGMTIERIDNNKGYNPSNCRWASRKEQARNTRQNRWIRFRGRTLCVKDWSRLLKIDTSTIYDRLKRGLSTKEVLHSTQEAKS